MHIFKSLSCLFFSLVLVACASDPTKAPCDEYGHFCGTKISINSMRG